jgi:C4-dicarboxylate-specific signal transduction histidine kinase
MLLLLSGAALLVAMVAGSAPQSEGWAVSLGLLALLADLGCPHLTRFGYFTPSAAFILASAAVPELGTRVAAVATLVALTTRTVWRGSRQSEARYRELLCDLLPLSMMLLAATLWPEPSIGPRLLVVGLLYGAVSLSYAFWESGKQKLEGALSQSFLFLRALQWILVVPGSALLALAVPEQPWLLVPALALLSIPWLTATRLSNANQTGLLLERERLLGEKNLESVQQRLQLLAQSRESLAEETALFRDFAASVAAYPDFEVSAEFVLNKVAALCPAQSTVIFVAGANGLEARAQRSPHKERLQGQVLLGLSEPAVEECARRGRVVLKSERNRQSDSLLGMEPAAIVFPLAGVGALYLGWATRPSLGTKTLGTLSTLVELSSAALKAALEKERVQQELSYHSEGHQSARERVERLEALILELTRASASLSPSQALASLQTVSLQLVRHDRGAYLVRLSGRSHRACWPSQPTPDVNALEGMTRAVGESGTPLVIEDIEGWRLSRPWSDCASYLVIPIADGGERTGLLVVARRGAPFSRLDCQVLQLAAVQMRIIFANCALHDEVVVSKQQLEESQAQLVWSSKMAAIGSLAAGVAHELNTPLGAILLRMETAVKSLEKSDTDSAKRKLKSGIQAATVARDIVAKLLNYSHDGDRGLKHQDLGGIIADAIELVAPQLKKDAVVVEYEPKPMPEVEVNATEIQQILVNLLMNSRDAILGLTPEGGRIQVDTGVAADNVWLTVTDSGPGLSEELAHRVFDPFFTTKGPGRGTGLGLSVSHQIAERHHGSLTCVARQPGAVFRLTLPVSPSS